MVTAAERRQVALDLHQLQHQIQQHPTAIDALIRHLDHIAPGDPQYEARDLATAAYFLATALNDAIQDTAPGMRVRWGSSGKPAAQPPHCQQCATDATV